MPDTPPLVDRLHPRVSAWFGSTFGAFTEAQAHTVPHILDGRSVLLSSPTGSGKTLAGFLGIIDHLARTHEADPLGNHTYALYISPLRALTYDVQKNLQAPLQGIGLQEDIRIALRTGDTTASERAKFKRKPAHIFLTTPESLAIVLCQPAYREAFKTLKYVIIDELHALAQNKRGAHLAVSLERLEKITTCGPLVRIGLSATVAPLDKVAKFLVGKSRPCEIVEATAGRDSIVEVLSPLKENPYPAAGWSGGRIIKDIARIVESKGATIIFTNTRSGAENISHRLKIALPDLAHVIETHHSSLSRDLRLDVEDRLKNGELRAVVCSTSLELGIDVGFIDTTIMISTPKGISRALQRIGRSGHSIHQQSHGILCATNINDLIECAVCAQMTKLRQLDPVKTAGPAADVAIQHIVGIAYQAPATRDEIYNTLTNAQPFQNFPRKKFDRLVDYLKGGGKSLEKQYTKTFGKLIESETGHLSLPNKKTERDYLVNIGTIHAEGMVKVYLNTRKKRLGEVEERFMKNLKVGDIFLLAGQVVKLIEATGTGEAFVKPSRGVPTIPSWNANKVPLASGLAREVTAFRTEIHRQLAQEALPPEDVTDWLVEEWFLSTSNATAIIKHFQNQYLLSQVPTANRILIELFRGDPEDDQDDRLHYFFHTLIGRSANDALSRILAYRLSQSVGGNALITIDDYGFLLTLKPFQELECEAWKELLHPADAELHLEAALAQSQLVKGQFSAVAQTGLMVPRNLPGKERRLKELRWNTEILFRVLSQHEPDHPLLQEAQREAKHSFLDLDRAQEFLNEAAEYEWEQIEVPAVSPFSFGIYASRIKEGMMLEDPDAAIERLYLRMSAKLEETAVSD